MKSLCSNGECLGVLFEEKVKIYKEKEDKITFELLYEINVIDELGVLGNNAELISLGNDFIIFTSSPLDNKTFRFLLVKKTEDKKEELIKKILELRVKNDRLLAENKSLKKSFKEKRIREEYGEGGVLNSESFILTNNIEEKLHNVLLQISKNNGSNNNCINVFLHKIFSESNSNESNYDKMFHGAVKGIKDTLCLFLTDKNRIFGGFASETWDDENDVEFKKDAKAFVFMMQDTGPKIFPVKRDAHAIFCNVNFGPCFCDVIETEPEICGKCGTTCLVEHSNYEGLSEKYEINAGVESFTVEKFECFRVIKLFG